MDVVWIQNNTHKLASLNVPTQNNIHRFQQPLLIISSKIYSKIPVIRPLSKIPNIGFQDQLSLNVCQKYGRMLQAEHSAILSTFIKLPFVIKIFFVYF